MDDRVLELEGKGVLPEPDESPEAYIDRAEERINAGYEFQDRLEEDPGGAIDDWWPRRYLADDPSPCDYDGAVAWLDEQYDIEPDWVPTAVSPVWLADGFSLNVHGEEFTEYVVVDPFADRYTRRHELLHTTRATRDHTESTVGDLLAPWHPFYAAEEVAVDELAGDDHTVRFLDENVRVQMANLQAGAVTGVAANMMYATGEQPTGSLEGGIAYGIAGIAGLIAAKSVSGLISASRMQSALSRFDGEYREVLARLATDEIHALADTVGEVGDIDDGVAQYITEQDGLKYDIIAHRYID
jgi:hypothetical protein